MKKLMLILFFMLAMSFSVYADINVDSVAPSPASIYAGQDLSLTVTVTNLDAAIDADVLITTSDASEAGGSNINLRDGDLVADGAIGPGASRTFTMDLGEIPFTVPATYTVTLRVQDVISGDVKTVTYTFAVLNPLALSIDGRDVSNPLSIGLESGEDDNPLVLTVENRGNVDLTNIRFNAAFSADDLEDNDGDVITIEEPGVIARLTPGGRATIEFNFDVDAGFDVSTISGNLEINTNEFDALRRTLVNSLELNVMPLACAPGARSSNLEVDINHPDDDDEFELGDTINVDLEINNNGDDDIDAKIEAVLYNTERDRKVDSKTVTKRVRDDDEENIEFDLELSDRNRDEDYTLFIKVFDDDDETDCTLEEVDLDVEVPEHKVKISDTTLTPTTVACGGRVSGTAFLSNVGDNDEDVVLEITNAQLGLNRVSPSFEMETDEDSRPVSFEFTIPQNLADGTYPVSFKAKYSGETSLSIVNLLVQGCTEQAQPTTQTGTTGTQVSGVSNGLTGASVLEEKSIFDRFNTGSSSMPTSVWILLDVLLVLLIIGALVWIFRPR